MAESSVLCDLLGIEVPLICGAMYPCSNPELVAAVSAAGGIGIVIAMAAVIGKCMLDSGAASTMPSGRTCSIKVFISLPISLLRYWQGCISSS